MKIRTLRSKALSMCLVVAIVATYSMVALAGDKKIAGEILVTGKNVVVNGEQVQTGRSIFSSSTITTPENSSAVINVNKVGKIKVAPNTSFVVSFSENGIAGDLLKGEVTVVNSSNTVNITTPNGQVAELTAGGTASTVKQDDDDDNTDPGAGAYLLYALIFGGAAAAIVIAATSDNNRVDLGGGSTVVSPSL